MKLHPYCKLFPALPEADLQELADDIKETGLREWIVTYQGAILHGQNRYAACKLAGVKPLTREFAGNDQAALALVISKNIRRRHLTESQRAIIAAELANIQGPGRPGKKVHPCTISEPGEKVHQCTISVPQAAEQMKVSERIVQNAKEVLRDAPAAEVEAIKRGEKTVGEVKRELAEQQPAKPEALLDCVEAECQREVPALIAETWQRATATAKDLLAKLRDAKAVMAEGIEHRDKDTIWADSTNTDFAGLSEVIGHINLHVKPHAVCPNCHGLKAGMKGCKLCKGRGYIGRHLWQTCVPQELKDVIKKAKRK